jgi:hypothetical protein
MVDGEPALRGERGVLSLLGVLVSDVLFEWFVASGADFECLVTERAPLKDSHCVKI